MKNRPKKFAISLIAMPVIIVMALFLPIVALIWPDMITLTDASDDAPVEKA